MPETAGSNVIENSNGTNDVQGGLSEVFHCNTGYLMNALGLLLQFLLALLAFTSLICKIIIVSSFLY